MERNGSIGSTEEPTGAPSTFEAISAILEAFALGVGQPVLDLVGRNAEFFIARDSPRSDIFLTAAVWTLVIPLAIVSIVELLRMRTERWGNPLLGGVIAILIGTFLIQFLDRTPWVGSFPGFLLIAIALALGGVVALKFFREPAFRSIVRLGLVVPVVVAGFFLFGYPTSDLAFPSEVASRPASDRSARFPIVMVVFDELPVATLMNEDRSIDRRLFPDFADLADTSTWFRNATTVGAFTHEAVPSLLDGSYPEEDALPVAGDHPDNVFTHLAGTYEINAFEPITALCPPQICDVGPRAGFFERWGSLTEDFSIIAAHLVLPDDMTGGLPAIDRQWGAFADQDAPAEGRIQEVIRQDSRSLFDRFVADLQPGRDRFHFFHSLLPHNPWRYLPSGQEYRAIEPEPGVVGPSEDGRVWGSDAWLLTQGYQRHILQVQYADRLLGKTIERLRTEGMYRDALVIVTSDHGTIFETDRARRDFDPETVGGLAAIPMFVKLPGQDRAEVDDYPAQTIDLFPTIAELAGLPEPEGVPGTALFDGPRPERTSRKFGFDQQRFGVSGLEKYEVVEEKYRMFGATGGALDPYGIAPGDSGGLLGRDVDEVGATTAVSGEVSLDDPDAFDEFDPSETRSRTSSGARCPRRTWPMGRWIWR